MGAGLLGNMSVRFGMNTSGLVQGASQAKGILSQLGSMNIGGAAAAGVAAIGAAAIGIGVVSVKAAADFQQSMLKVQAYAGLSTQQTKAMGDSILQMAANLGQSPKAMADAIYPIISSGYNASQALNILQLSAKTAASSGANMATVADMLTTSLKASGAPASQAGHYMDMFNKIVALGKGEVPQYAAVLGKLTLAAGGAHIPFDQMGAALATLTTHGFPSVAQASTALGNLFTQIGPKVDALATHAQKLGLNFNETAFKSMSLSQQMNYLQKITGGNTGELLKLMGGSNLALKAFVSLQKAGSDFTDNLKGMKNATGMTDSAFKTASSGLNASMSRISASVQVLEVKIGQALIPTITKVTNLIAPLITKFANWVTTSNIIPNSIDAVQKGLTLLGVAINRTIGFINSVVIAVQNVHNWFIQWQTPITVVAGLITAFFLPALIRAGVQAGISGVQITAGFISSMVKTGAAAVVNGAKTSISFVASMVKAGAEAWTSGAKVVAGFVGPMIQTGAAAVANAAKVTGSFVASMVTAAAKAVWAGIQITASFVASLVKTAAQAVITGATFLASLVPAIIAFVAESLTAAATAIPAMLVGFGAWIVSAGAAAVATIAATWPILLIIAAIALFVVGIILLVQHWGQVVAFMTGIWQKFTSWIQGALQNLKAFFLNVWNGILNFLKIVGLAILAVIIGPIGLLVIYVITHFTQVKNFITTIFNAVLAIIHGVWTNITNSIHSAIMNIWNGINNFFGGLPGKMLSFGVDMIQGFINGVMSMAGNLLGAIGGLFSNLGSSVHGALHGAGIPGFAGGVQNFSGGWAIVGERGPELVQLPQGANVYPSGSGPAFTGNNGSSVNATSQNGGGQQDIYIQLDSTTLAHMIGNKQSKIVRARMARRSA